MRVFSEQELADLNLLVMSTNSWNRLAIPFRFDPDREFVDLEKVDLRSSF